MNFPKPNALYFALNGLFTPSEVRPDLEPIADTLHSATNHPYPSMAVQLTGSMPGRDVRQEGQAT